MAGSGMSVRIRFDAAGASLARVRAIVESMLATDGRARFRREEIDEILLGLQESLTNVARHAYPKSDPALVELLVTVEQGRFRASIAHRGRGFEAPAPNPQRAANEPRPSGYGLLLIDRTMDRVAHRRRGRKNLVRLSRAITPAEPEPIRIKLRPVGSR